MALPDFLERVLFVVVVYRQRFKETQASASLTTLLRRYPGRVTIFVYDNSPERDDTMLDVHHYLHDSENHGVSRAYNTASEFARDAGFQFMLLMDQDTTFAEQIFQSYRDAVASYPDIHVFAPIAKDSKHTFSPFKFSAGRGRGIENLKPGIYNLTNLKVINSGLLISLQAFFACGGYDERFPLDFSDIVFCERLASAGYDVCIIADSIRHQHSSLQAQLSDHARKRFEHYLKALTLYKAIGKGSVSYWRSGFPTAARLSAQLRDTWYIRKFLNLR